MKMLLLSCCAPCAVGVIEKLKNSKVDFSVYFFNPNIKPQIEFERRAEEMARICDYFGVKFILEPYQPSLWDDAISSDLIDLPERSLRCSVCFELRLSQTFKYAQENGYTTVSSVLGFSRYKSIEQVNLIAEKLQTQTIQYDMTNWRKQGCQERTQELIKQLGIYHQTYCGCKPKDSF